ncbi:hypothetical protein GCM10023091_08650 [Ravibacter arvi]|uniref:Peptidase S24/S26A/S26B/S26C domain-containing protein n=1 Tax=Ravibacter arvi TaxID=2051041 RepID=A0ABP8LSX9_9BACT
MFSDRLREFIAAIGETPTSIEPKIGVSKGAIYKPVKNGKTIGIEIIAKILAAYPRLNLEWLICNIGTMWKNPFTIAGAAGETASEDPADMYYLAGARTPVNLISETNALNWSGTREKGENAIESVFFLPPGLLRKGPDYAAFPAGGPQMEPTIPANSLVVAEIIKPKDYSRIKNGDVYVIITKDTLAIRRLNNRIKERNTLLASPDNREFTAYDIPIDTVVSLWKARALISDKFTGETHRLFDLYQDLEERIRQLENKNKPL